MGTLIFESYYDEKFLSVSKLLLYSDSFKLYWKFFKNAICEMEMLHSRSRFRGIAHVAINHYDEV